MESLHLAFTAFIHEKLNRSIYAIEAVPTYSRSALLTQTKIEWSPDNKKYVIPSINKKIETLLTTVNEAHHTASATVSSFSIFAVGVTPIPSSSGGGGAGGSGTTDTTYSEAYFDLYPLARFEIRSSAFLNAGGISITQAQVGQQISISGTIVNHQQTSQNYAYIVQIFDMDDVVADISWQQASVESGHTSKISTSWTPQEAGIYTVKIFVWDGVSDTPLPLSDVTADFLQVSQR